MASVTESPVPRQYVDFDEYIDFQLRKTGSDIRLTDILTAAGGAAALVLAYLLAFVVLDHWFVPGGFGYAARWMMLSIVMLAAAAWVGWKVVLPYTRRVTRLYSALAIEHAEPSLKSTLLNLVDLRRARRPVSTEVLNTLEKRAALTLTHADIDHAVDRRQLMRVSYALLFIVVACCLYTLFSPKDISNSLWRALFPASEIDVATRTEIVEVEPGDVEVLAGAQLEITADLRGETPERVMLYFTTEDRRYVDEPLEMRLVEDGLRQYQALLAGENGRGILQPTTYHVVAGDDRSRDFQITVHTPPTATVDEVRYEFPAYMELPPRMQPGGHIDAWEGTKISLGATANMPLKSARLVLSDEENPGSWAGDFRLDVNDTKLRLDKSAKWILDLRNDKNYARYYRIECRNLQDQTDPDPTLYSIKVRADQPPEIVLIDPTSDLTKPANAVIPLLVEAHDPDFKLRYVTLKLEKNGEELPGIYLFDGTTSPLRQSFSTRYDWRLERLELQPGDELTFWIEARDNKEPLANRAVTPKLNVRIEQPAPQPEVERQLAEDKRKQEEKLEELRQDRNPDDLREPADAGSGEREPDLEQDNAERSGEPQQNPEASDEGDEGKSDSPKEDERGEPGEGSQRPDNNGQRREQPADDHEALERLIQESNRENPPGQQQSGENGEGEPQKDRPEGGEPQQPPNGEGEQHQRPQPGETASGEDADGAEGGQEGAGGKPSTDPSRNPNSESGGEEGQPMPPQGTPNEGRNSEKPLDGSREPAEDDPSARKEQATGQEKGPATGADQPDPDATRAENKLDREPGKEGAKQPSRDPKDPNATQQKDPTAKNGEPGGTSTDPGNKPPAEQGQPNGSVRPSDSQKGPNGQQRNPQQRPDNLPGGQPTDPNAQPGGTPKEQPGNPQPGDSQQPGGEGETTQQPQDQGGKPDGNSGGKPQQSDEPGGGKTPGGAESQGSSSESEGSEGQGSGSSKTTDPKSGGSLGESAGNSSSPTGGGASGSKPSQAGPQGDGEGGEGSPAAPPADEANLEFTKQAANLALKRLEEDLRRGEVDPKLLDELGWTEDDMRQFAERLQQQLNAPGDDQSPESLAKRRQFEEMLKSLNLDSTAAERKARTDGRSASEGVGPRRLPVPAEYREAYEAFTRSLAKKQSAR